ncbi:MAG: holo-ACP synthase [Alphaproteobacteria bacterium]|nr:holo-ACP synthase [Alphaproteobacteria bacterium]
MITGIGSDIVKTGRVRDLAMRWGDRFLARVFSKDELEIARSRSGSDEKFYGTLAKRWAGKEAVGKALGIGIWRLGLSNISIVTGENGRPVVRFSGRAAEIAKGVTVHISLTDDDGMAMAFAVAEKR